ncbi:MAG TPA: hypothetical protein VKK31_24525 [Thermoanaerobaculia bacterium]|nr:hypothetical protein [Thermoanaerobaculia bacterium]
MKRLHCLGVVALVLALVVPAGASTFVALSRQQLVAQSDAVIQGRVLKVSSYWGQGGRVIMTEALIQVEEKIRGNAPTVVKVRTFGGSVGGYNVEAHGFPKFAVNERLVLFLQNANETAEVTGYQQGQYRIVRDKSGVDIAVSAVDGGATLLGRNGRQVAMPKAMQLDALKNLIRADVERPGRTAN